MLVYRTQQEKEMKDGYKIINSVIDKNMCEWLIANSERIGYKAADISYAEGAKMNTDIRDNSRVLMQDEMFREGLETALMPYVPMTRMFIKEGGEVSHRKFLRLSGNFRFYKYEPGQKFKRHRDGNVLEEGGIALVTVLVYLNTVDPYDGGFTNMCDRMLENPVLVQPLEGRVLMFDHSLMHSGDELKNGVKYVLRTDLIYSLE